jgi:acetoacetyl-CoA synthetase
MTAPNIPLIRLYQDWLRATRGLSFDNYDALWRWSVTDLEGFWRSIWDYADVRSPAPPATVLAERRMPGAVWFPDTRVNYAREVLRHVDAAHAAGQPAIVSEDERGTVREMSWPELRRQVASVALELRALGVRRGDRVAAYLPNVPETIVAFLACSSIGAVWSVCAPDMGAAAVVDRFRQIEPVVLIATDGVHYGGRPLDRGAVVRELRAQLPSVRSLLLVRSGYATGTLDAEADWAAASARDDAAVAAFEPEWLPFDHPIWILYSSGTTGLPKAIVHGQGGIILTMYACGLHNDIGAAYSANNAGERYHWYSSTGWVMWNSQLSGLAMGATIALYDGAARLGRAVALRGAPPGHLLRRRRGLLRQLHEGRCRRRRLWRPVPRAGARQHRLAAGRGRAALGHRELPEVPGQMQCRQLGAAVEAWDEQGRPVVGEVGELVCVQPIPSMPLYLWNDPDRARYLSSYFDTYPGIWRHGDWIRIGADGGCVIYGRSDATINRQGLRMGTSEIYSAVERLPEVLDSMVVDLEYLGRESYMPLFVVLREGHALDDALRERIARAIRTSLSPRFVPDEVFQVAEIPRTLSGKKQELPIKKLLLGQPIEKVVNREAMANPGCLDWYVELAARRRATAAASAA